MHVFVSDMYPQKYTSKVYFVQIQNMEPIVCLFSQHYIDITYVVRQQVYSTQYSVQCIVHALCIEIRMVWNLGGHKYTFYSKLPKMGGGGHLPLCFLDADAHGYYQNEQQDHSNGTYIIVAHHATFWFSRGSGLCTHQRLMNNCIFLIGFVNNVDFIIYFYLKVINQRLVHTYKCKRCKIQQDQLEFLYRVHECCALVRCLKAQSIHQLAFWHVLSELYELSPLYTD